MGTTATNTLNTKAWTYPFTATPTTEKLVKAATIGNTIKPSEKELFAKLETILKQYCIYTDGYSAMFGKNSPYTTMYGPLLEYAPEKSTDKAYMYSTERVHTTSPEAAMLFAQLTMLDTMKGSQDQASFVIKHAPGIGSITEHPEKGTQCANLNLTIQQLDTQMDFFAKTYNVLPGKIAIMLSGVNIPALNTVGETGPFCYSAKGVSYVRRKVGQEALLISDDTTATPFMAYLCRKYPKDMCLEIKPTRFDKVNGKAAQIWKVLENQGLIKSAGDKKILQAKFTGDIEQLLKIDFRLDGLADLTPEEKNRVGQALCWDQRQSTFARLTCRESLTHGIDMAIFLNGQGTQDIADWITEAKILLAQGVISRKDLEISATRILQYKKNIFPNHPYFKGKSISQIVSNMSIEQLVGQRLIASAYNKSEATWGKNSTELIQMGVGGISCEGAESKQATEIYNAIALLSPSLCPALVLNNPPQENMYFNKALPEKYKKEAEYIHQFDNLFSKVPPADRGRFSEALLAAVF